MLSRLDLVVADRARRDRRNPPEPPCACAAREVDAAVLALGSVPLVLWHLFALIYYGFLFPNTAYAKLGTGLSSSKLMAQGLRYLSESFRNDPLTLLTIAAAVLAALWWRDRADGGARLRARGVSSAFVVRAGGDFMSGRFLTPPFLCAVVLLAMRLPEARWPDATGRARWRAGRRESGDRRRRRLRMGAFARRVPNRFASNTGSSTNAACTLPRRDSCSRSAASATPSHMWAHSTLLACRRSGRSARSACSASPRARDFTGSIRSPSRIRCWRGCAVAPGTAWRIGHFERTLPEGYEETLQAVCAAACSRRAPSGRRLANCLSSWDEINRFRDPTARAAPIAS